jgi:Pentapeptide repeats (9 copies)
MPCAFQFEHHLRQTRGCQFAVPEAELAQFDDSTWCPFHLPLKAKAQWDANRIHLFLDEIFARIEEAKTRSDQLPAPPYDYAPVGWGEMGKQRTADLSGVVFPKHVTFERYAGSASGLPDVLFLKAVFGGCALFNMITFKGTAQFDEATFAGMASFNNVTFADSGRFHRATFGGTVSFKYTTFNHDAGFSGAVFRDFALFDGARFDREAYFGRTTFDREAWFDEASFGKNAWFDGDPAAQGASGGANVFRAAVSFRRATFGERAVFINRRFLNSTDFRDATFKVAPEFHNGVLHQDTRFSGTRFLDRKGTDEVDAAGAYRTLKLAMERLRARDEEAMFYAYEQQSLRKKEETRRSVKWISKLYEVTADYGRSFMRPFWWFLGTLAFLCLIYFIALTDAPGREVAACLDARTTGYQTCGEVLADAKQAVRFGLQQVFQPFATFRPGTAMEGRATSVVPLWLAFVAAVHSLLTLAFLALFLLAVRRRFKLD